MCGFSFVVTRMYEITLTEYNRYLQMEVQLIKYKVLCERKAKEIKSLQDQVARYKRKEMKRTSELPQPEDSTTSNVPNVNRIY